MHRGTKRASNLARYPCQHITRTRVPRGLDPSLAFATPPSAQHSRGCLPPFPAVTGGQSGHRSQCPGSGSFLLSPWGIRSQQLGRRAGLVAENQPAKASTIPVSVSYRHVMCSAQSRSQSSKLTYAPPSATGFDLIILLEQAHPQPPSQLSSDCASVYGAATTGSSEPLSCLPGALTIGPHPRIWPFGDSVPSTSPGDGARPPPPLVCKCGLPKLCRGGGFGQRAVMLTNS